MPQAGRRGLVGCTVRAPTDAEGGARTHTPLRAPDFESGASTGSATSAWADGKAWDGELAYRPEAGFAGREAKGGTIRVQREEGARGGQWFPMS